MNTRKWKRLTPAGPSNTVIAGKYSTCIARSTLANIKKDASKVEAYMKSMEKGFRKATPKTMKTGEYKKLDEALCMYVHCEALHTHSIPVQRSHRCPEKSSPGSYLQTGKQVTSSNERKCKDIQEIAQSNEILVHLQITISDPANTDHQLFLVGGISTFITHDGVEA